MEQKILIVERTQTVKGLCDPPPPSALLLQVSLPSSRSTQPKLQHYLRAQKDGGGSSYSFARSLPPPRLFQFFSLGGSVLLAAVLGQSESFLITTTAGGRRRRRKRIGWRIRRRIFFFFLLQAEKKGFSLCFVGCSPSWPNRQWCKRWGKYIISVLRNIVPKK